jgi:hypothetical protein
MVRIFFVATLSISILAVGQVASAANFFDDCKAACVKGYPVCIDQITEVNYDEVQAARAKCETDRDQCIKKCHDEDEGRVKPEPQEKTTSEQQDQAPPAQQDQDSLDGIKVYQFK